MSCIYQQLRATSVAAAAAYLVKSRRGGLMICLLGSSFAKLDQDTETSSRCVYDNSYLLYLCPSKQEKRTFILLHLQEEQS